MKTELVYGALAVLLLFSLGFAFYVFGEIQSLNQKLASIQRTPETTTVLITSLERRLTSLERQVRQQSAAVKLIAFYDSSCTVCANELFLEAIPAIKGNLEQQGIRVETVDVKNNPQAALAVNVKMVPTFFASASDLALSPNLVNFINSLASASFGLQELSTGVIAQPPTTQLILSSSSCAQNGSVKVEEFYSTTCPFCRRVFYPNGTLYNPPDRPIFADVSGEALQKVTTKYGGKIQNASYCINVHSLEENKNVLNISASDGALCIERIGEKAYQEGERLASAYGVIGAPTFVVDCKYATKVREGQRLEKALCILQPDLCA